MEKAQGLPITTVVLIVICILVLVVIILFFLGGFGSGQSSVNTFQCQQQCQTIIVTLKANQTCNGIATLNTAISYCNSGCKTKAPCILPPGNYCGGWNVIGEQCISCGNLGPGKGPC
jgi:hypothetical protein